MLFFSRFEESSIYYISYPTPFLYPTNTAPAILSTSVPLSKKSKILAQRIIIHVLITASYYLFVLVSIIRNIKLKLTGIAAGQLYTEISILESAQLTFQQCFKLKKNICFFQLPDFVYNIYILSAGIILIVNKVITRSIQNDSTFLRKVVC